MRASSYLVCLWPGLPRLWLRGDWSALATAVTFGMCFNLILVASVVWPGLLPAPWAAVGWLVVSAAWTLSAYHSWRSLPRLREPPHANDPGLFIQAQAEYLKCHWFEAETLLRKLLTQSRNDAEARLLLATLYRRTRRPEEALQQLRHLERLDAAARWRWEIDQEQRLLKRLVQSMSTGADLSSHGGDLGTEPGTDASQEGSQATPS